MEISNPTVWAEALRTSPSLLFLFLLPILWVGVNTVGICGVHFVAFSKLTTSQKTILQKLLLPGLYLQERFNAYLYLFFGAKQIDSAYAKVRDPFFLMSTHWKIHYNADLPHLIGQWQVVHDSCS
jgi:hypothetical protein